MARAREDAARGTTPESGTGGRSEEPGRRTDVAQIQAEDGGGTGARVTGGAAGGGREGASGSERDGVTGGQVETPGRETDVGDLQEEDATRDGGATGEPGQVAAGGRVAEGERSRAVEDEPFAGQDMAESDTADPLDEAGPTRPDRVAPAADRQETRPDTASGEPGQPADRTARPTAAAERSTSAPDGTTGDTPSPPDDQDTAADEKTGGSRDVRVDSDAPDADRGGKAEGDGGDPEPTETGETDPADAANPILTDVRLDDDGRVRIEPRYGREQAAEAAPARTETRDPAGLPTREQLDPAGAQAEPGRGELQDPSDDPADRDPRDRDPERTTRRKNFVLESISRSGDIEKVVNKAAERTSANMDRKPPTGQPSTVRDTSQSTDPANPPVKVGSVTFGFLGVAIVATQAARWTAGKVRELRGRRHAGD
ncbi:hypothetical protein [Actinomadura meridiana]|uniref:hypothetical protein n=1 Tax=Actinomadura meridiana TaxID=559626 RepID=UPI0031E8080A